MLDSLLFDTLYTKFFFEFPENDFLLFGSSDFGGSELLLVKDSNSILTILVFFDALSSFLKG